VVGLESEGGSSQGERIGWCLTAARMLVEELGVETSGDELGMLEDGSELIAIGHRAVDAGGPEGTARMRIALVRSAPWATILATIES
jgi:hypothetical protein